MPVAVAVLGRSLSQVKYVWSPSFLDPACQKASRVLGPENLDVVDLDLPWFDQMRDGEQSPKNNA